MEALAEALNDDEAALGLPLTRRPDPTFVPLAHAWALGQQLDDVLADEDLTGGDFVRNVRLLIDLLRQVADHADRADTRRAAGRGGRGPVPRRHRGVERRRRWRPTRGAPRRLRGRRPAESARSRRSRGSAGPDPA